MTLIEADPLTQPKKKPGRPVGWKKTPDVSRETIPLKTPLKELPVNTDRVAKGYFVSETEDGRYLAFRAFIKEGQVIHTTPWIQTQPEKQFAEDDMLKMMNEDGIR